MQSPYQYEVLSLETPDDDPTWTAYVNVFHAVFLDGRVTPEGVATFQKHRRQDRAVLGMVTTEGPGLDGRQPVAAFNVTPATINEGRGLRPLLIVNTIGVLPSHRRRGLLKEMMRRQLDAAVASGTALAVLTASEATIYGRFGFAPSSRGQELKLDTRRFAFHAGAAVAEGPIEFVEPSFLDDHWARITREHQERHRGAVEQTHANFLIDTGAWDPNSSGPSKDMRAVVHFGADGLPDGFAVFRFKGWDESPQAKVVKVCAAEASVERALWKALADMDLVETLTYELSGPNHHLSLSLADERAVKVSSLGDWVWLRILDVPGAVAGRAFDSDGQVVVGIDDPMGYASGTWRITAADGAGSAELTDAEPEVRLNVATLALLWHNDRTATQAAEAGLVLGAPEAIRRLGRLLHWDESAENLALF